MHRISMRIHGHAWISMNVCGYPWISMDIYEYPWISMHIHGYPWKSIVSMYVHGCPWISMDIHGDPLYLFVNWYQFGISFGSVWGPFVVSLKSVLLHQEYSKFEIFRFSLSYFMNYSILCYFARSRKPPRISFEAAGASKDNFGGILCSNLQEFSKSWK